MVFNKKLAGVAVVLGGAAAALGIGTANANPITSGTIEALPFDGKITPDALDLGVAQLVPNYEDSTAQLQTLTGQDILLGAPVQRALPTADLPTLDQASEIAPSVGQVGNVIPNLGA